MSDGVGFWNRRHDFCDFAAFERITVRRHIEEDLVAGVLDKMTTLKWNFVKPSVWSEVSILQTVLYKHHNQHRKEKYFQGLQRVHKLLKRLQELEIHKSLEQVIQQFPRVGDRDARDTGPSNFPSVEMISYLLGCMMGVAKLTMHILVMCEETVKHVLGQLAHGFFVTFHVVSVASLSRVWVLLKDLLQDTVDCYNAARPWIKLLGKPNKEETLSSTNFPECLKSWLAPENSATALKRSVGRQFLQNGSTPVMLKSSSLLEKLFASTPGPSPQSGSATGAVDSDPLPDVGLPSSPVTDHGELVVSREGSFVDEVEMSSKKKKKTFDQMDVPTNHHPALSSHKRRNPESDNARRPAKKKRNPGRTREEDSGGRLLKTKPRSLSRSFPVFRTSCSPTMRTKERCRKLLFQRRNGSKRGSFLCGITKSLSDNNYSNWLERHEKNSDRNSVGQSVNSGNLRTGKDECGETTEDWISLGKDLDTKRRRKRSLATVQGLGQAPGCHVICGLEQKRRLRPLSNHSSSQRHPGEVHITHSRVDIEAANTRQRAKEDDIDNIFRSLDV